MATGLALPVGADKRGRAKLVSDDAEANQIIMTALSDCDNAHAFQQGIGLGAGMVFDPQDAAVRAKVMIRVLRIFRIFQAANKFKLQRASVRWIPDSSNQELTLEFKYINLETDEEKVFRRTFTGAT